MNAALRPRVSVIVITTGKSELLRYALESIIAQTFVNFEVWVIENNSESTDELVQSFYDPRIRSIHAPSNKDEFSLILEGQRRCRGSYTAYLCANDIWLSNHLELLVNAVESHNTDVAFSITQLVHAKNLSTLNIPLPELEIRPHLSALMHRRDCLFIHSAEKENDDFVHEFFRRARLENLSMHAVPIVTGLSFLPAAPVNDELLQAYFMKQLKTDPDFVNRELSAILLRKEKLTKKINTNLTLWLGRISWVARPLQRLIRAIAGRRAEPVPRASSVAMRAISNDVNAN